MTALDVKTARSRFVALVDALPDEERTAVDSVFWEGATLREVARRLGWKLPGGDFDGKKVERTLEQAMTRLRHGCTLFGLDFGVLFGFDEEVA